MLDSHLPDGLGLDFVKKAKQLATDSGHPMPPVISMSGSSEADQRALYSGYSVVAFLVKPVKKQEAIDLIRII